MPERSLDGHATVQLPVAEPRIAQTTAHRAAFIGRTLRGPVNQPVEVKSFAEYQRVFGDLWQPSPLSYAIEHFFEQGGRAAVVVRVTNGARAVTLGLKAGTEFLHLEARDPGTREYLRASVDYDHIPADDEQRFNLVIQRLRAPDSSRIEVQETFRSVSIDPESPRYVPLALASSELVRVRGDVPRTRPDLTLHAGSNLPVGYVQSNPDGDDGKPLTDYDVIGSSAKRTGLFALDGIADLAFVYIPPLTRTADIGASTLVVALQFCRQRQLLLIVDPPAAWSDASAALAGRKQLPVYSDVAVMFFPRVLAHDKLRGRTEVFANGGAVAGILARAHQDIAKFALEPQPEPVLRAGARLATEVTPAERWHLAAEGINTLASVRSPSREWPILRTLGCGASTAALGHDLAQRRFAFALVNAIAQGTSWCRHLARDAQVWSQVRTQVRTFLEALYMQGVFGTADEHETFFVICDERLHSDGDRDVLSCLVQFAGSRPGTRHSYMISHSPQGTLARPVVVNQLQASLVVEEYFDNDSTTRLYIGGAA